jgi:hypothetical protein
MYSDSEQPEKKTVVHNSNKYNDIRMRRKELVE